MTEVKIDIKDKPFMTLEEAAAFFGVGITKLKKITNRNENLVLFNGSKRLIKKKKMEEYLNREYSI